MLLPGGRHERRKAGERTPGLLAGLRGVQSPEPIVELVGREATFGHVLAENLRDQLSIGITDAKVACVRLSLGATGHRRRRGRGTGGPRQRTDARGIDRDS